MVQVAVIVVVVAAVMIWWYRMYKQAQITIAEFKAASERVRGDSLRIAQEKFMQAELALGVENNEVNQRAFNEAFYELNAIKNTI